MRCWVVMVAILLFAISLPARADDGVGWSWEPFEIKYSRSVSGTESTRVDWGADYSFSEGSLTVSAWGSWPGDDRQIELDWSRESDVWGLGAWGILKCDQNYNTPSLGWNVDWEKQGLSWGTSFSFERRNPFDPESQYGYGGWEVKADCGYRLDNGCWIKLGIDQTATDYPDYNNSSAKTDLDGSLRWKIAKTRWLLSWKEWSYDYPDKPTGNSWGEQYGLSWTYPLESRQWSAAVTAYERQSGDGTTSRKNQLNVGETLFLKSSVWSWKYVGTWQDGSSWIEDTYDLTGDSAESWGLNSSVTHGITWSWQREFGPHRQWKLGGGLDRNATDDFSWSCHSEWDCYLGEWRMRFYLNLTGKDNQSEVGAWVKMTYYFS